MADYSAPSGVSIYGGKIAPPSGLSISGRGVLAGDSLTDISYGRGGYAWGLARARSPWPVVYNAGVASDTIAMLVARWNTDVLAHDPDWVMLRIGTNSIDVPEATFKSQYMQLIDSLLANGIFGFIHAVPPRGSLGATVRARCDWLASVCAAHPGQLLFLDDSVDLGDGSYNYLPAYYSDAGIHMNALGKRAQGVRMAPGLISAFAPHDPRILDGTDTYAQNPASNQWVRNPLMTGTGGGRTQTTGVVPDTWEVTGYGSGTTNAASIVPADVGDAVQVPWLRLSPQTCANASHQAWVTTTLSHPALAANLDTVRRLDVVAEVRFVGFDTAAANTLVMYCLGGTINLAQDGGVPLAGMGTLDETVILRTSVPRDQEGVAVVTHAANTISLRFELKYRSTFSAPIGAIDIRCASVRGLGV